MKEEQGRRGEMKRDRQSYHVYAFICMHVKQMGKEEEEEEKNERVMTVINERAATIIFQQHFR